MYSHEEPERDKNLVKSLLIGLTIFIFKIFTYEFLRIYTINRFLDLLKLVNLHKKIRTRQSNNYLMSKSDFLRFTGCDIKASI